MKVVHLCLGAFFPDNYSYQENLLPKFHKKMGYDVEVIASQETFDENGNTSYMQTVGSYRNEHDIKVNRLKYAFPEKINHKMKSYIGVHDAIEESKPDIIFMHNCQFLSVFDIIRYLKKHPEVKLFVDNHVDFSNSAKNFLSKNILHGIIWKFCAKSINKYAEKFYGVLPARVDFLVNVYGLPKEKCELLVMGADDDEISKVENSDARGMKRAEYNVKDDEILVVTGGKIDLFKQQTLLLMQAVNEMENEKVKLCVFGSVVPEMKDKFDSLLSDKVIYSGWKKPTESYNEFAAADIVVFPGRHSVFWEQVAAMGIPMICKKWAGTTHVDMGGNVIFLENDSVEEIKNAIKEMIANYENYKNAAKSGKQYFLYSDIAKRSIADIKE